MKKVLSIVLIVTLLTVVLFALSGCEKTDSSSSNNTNNATQNKTTTSAKKENSESEGKKVDYKAYAEKQMAMPETGEQIAIFHVKDFGDIKVKFFPDVAPKSVENFITHAKEGYYNGVTFHRVINEFMIQGGDPKGDGTGGESIWGHGFELEVDSSLVPYRGSLCMARTSDPNSNGSQFFITQAHANSQMASQMRIPSDLLEEYNQYGGYLSLYKQYTVFGQVFEGMEVVDKIAAVETNDSDKPLKDVIISSIDVSNYQ